MADGSLFSTPAGPPPRARRRRVDEEIDVDLFAGGGGASEAIRRATGFTLPISGTYYSFPD